MQNFKYVAVNLQKEKFTGIFQAQDERDLAVQLAKQNLFLISATSYKGVTPNAFFSLTGGKVEIGELTTFCRQFAIMINSGIAIMPALSALRMQSYSGYFKSVLAIVYEDVKGGMMMSDALNKHKQVFPDFFRSMVYVGEVSGKLDMVLTSLADYYEKDAATKRKVKSALSYPIMLACLTVGIIILMLAFVVPTFRSSLSSLNVEPEGLTKAVYDISDWILAEWKTVLLVTLGVILLIMLVMKTEKGKFLWDAFKLKCPLADKINLNLITSRFARGFSLLLSSGMDIIDAMDAISIVLGNRELQARFKKATEDVRQGMSLTTAFETYKLFPQMMIQMISVGEKTAALDEVLTRTCGFFDEQVDASLSSLTAILQPVMMGIMGVVVGTLFLAVYSPMISIMTNLT